jgi:hypothetical protein
VAERFLKASRLSFSVFLIAPQVFPQFRLVAAALSYCGAEADPFRRHGSGPDRPRQGAPS